MKTLTVKELAERLAIMVELGYGESPVLYMDRDSAVYPFDIGIHDIWRPTTENEVNTVILG